MLLNEQLTDDIRRTATAVKSLSRRAGALEKALESLDLQALEKNLVALRQSLEDITPGVREAMEQLRQRELDPRGDAAGMYAAALEAECLRYGLRLGRHFPDYEIPPLRVTVDLVKGIARVGQQRMTALDPKVLAKEIARTYRQLFSKDFYPQRFADALAIVYDTLTNGNTGQPIPLRQVHIILAARSGVRGADGYSREQFAMDIYRFRTQTDLMHGGRRFYFNPPSARQAADAIAIPTASGARENLSTMTMEQVDRDGR